MKIGSNISLLQTFYPEPSGHLSGSASDNTFSVEIKKGVFSRVVYYHDGVGNDPKICQITFWFRNENSAQKIRREALFFLGTENVESKILGKVLEWDNIEGVRIRIDMRVYSLLTPYSF